MNYSIILNENEINDITGKINIIIDKAKLLPENELVEVYSFLSIPSLTDDAILTEFYDPNDCDLKFSKLRFPKVDVVNKLKRYVDFITDINRIENSSNKTIIHPILKSRKIKLHAIMINCNILSDSIANKLEKHEYK